MKHSILRACGHVIVAAAALAALLTAPPLWAQEATITPNYRDADIKQVIDAVQAVTGRTMIVDPRVNAKVTLIASEPMSPEEFYLAFLQLLDVNNFVAIEAGTVTRVVPNANSRQAPANVTRVLDDEIITTVIRVENVSAAQLVPVLRPLLPSNAHLAAVASSNALIVSDTKRNVNRIEILLRRIDQPNDADVEIVQLTHASATDIVTTINALSSGARVEAGASAPINLVADARTNSVLISGVPADRLKIRTLIAHLDTPREAGGDTQVRYLKYANAEDLATKLQGQVQAAEGQQQAAPMDVEVNIWADEITNALVITAPPATMRSLMAVIDQLDIRRAQVLVEALIVEVNIDRDSQLGVTWALDGSNEDNLIGATDFASSGGRVVPLAGAAGADDASAIAQAISEGITLGVGRITDTGTSFAAILNALQGDANTNVISTPVLVTMDNEEAKIEIGQEVPFITGQFTNTGGNNQGAVNPFQTVNREKVGTLLELTPQITDDGTILLKIKQEISSLSTSAGAVDLITNERLIETAVIVEDGGILVLGGLIDDQLLETDQRVPVLGRIPLLGNLFRSRRTEKIKTNLMVFIKPRIILDGLGSLEVTGQKYNYLRNLQQRDGAVPLMRDATVPMLPPLENQVPGNTPGGTPGNTPGSTPPAIMEEDAGGE